MQRLQAVRSVTSDSKFYRLPPDKENTALYHALQIFMVTVCVCSKLKTSWKSVVSTNKVGKNSWYFGGIFNKTINYSTRACWMWDDYIANLALGASLALYHLISNMHLWNILLNITCYFHQLSCVWRYGVFTRKLTCCSGTQNFQVSTPHGQGIQ